MKNKLWVGAGWLGLIALFLGCARVGSPGGGETDKAPPVVVDANPPFGQTGFSGSALRLTFDEFVKLKDARRQVLVSPPLPESPRLLVKGRSILVDLGEGLMPKRTYVVQFGEAVVDLRESNVAAGLTHVFSTGDVLDSGRVQGEVVDAWTGLPFSGARVLLYADSLPAVATNFFLPDSLRPLPDYVGLVLDSGRFEIGFLPEGQFSALVLDDVNGNYLADAGEAVAWLEAPMPTLTKDTAVQASTFKMGTPPRQAITYVSGSAVDSSGYWRAKIEGLTEWMSGPDGPLESELGLELLGPDSEVVLHLEGDSVWSEFPNFDPGEVSGLWQLKHPAGTDTLTFREVGPARGPVLVESPQGKLAPSDGLSLRLAPLADRLDTTLCSGVQILDGDTVRLDRTGLHLEGARLCFAPLVHEARYQIELEPGALTRRGFGNQDTLRLSFMALGENATGSILLTMDSTLLDSDRVLHVLTDGKGAPLYNLRLDPSSRFSGLPPGQYGLVRIDDEDGNGRWTGTDPIQRRHAERVEVVAKEVTVRAGWEIELTSGLLPRP